MIARPGTHFSNWGVKVWSAATLDLLRLMGVFVSCGGVSDNSGWYLLGFLNLPVALSLSLWRPKQIHCRETPCAGSPRQSTSLLPPKTAKPNTQTDRNQARRPRDISGTRLTSRAKPRGHNPGAQTCPDYSDDLNPQSPNISRLLACRAKIAATPLLRRKKQPLCRIWVSIFLHTPRFKKT